jgi:GMP synthase (glutamine-hydrolysing)
MKQLCIIKVGSTFPHISAKMGDFEDWFLAGMQLPRSRVSLVDVRQPHTLPGYDELCGVIITGSHAMVTEHNDWSESTARWLPGVVEREIPLMGVCYGHQLLAHALGGRVANNPHGRHFGTVEVALTHQAQNDRLLGGLGSTVPVIVCHTQSVIDLPPGAVLLAACATDPHQAFRVGKCAWGVQFHPEFNAQALEAYILHFRGDLQAEQQDVEALAAACRDTPAGTKLLQRFAALALQDQPLFSPLPEEQSI